MPATIEVRADPNCDLGTAWEASGRGRDAATRSGAMSHPHDPRAPGRVALAVAEAGLLVLALGVAASFTRLFQGWDWLARLAVAGHRRLGRGTR